MSHFAEIPETTVLLLPGWLNSGAQHWQCLWAQKHGAVLIDQHDWVTPRRGDWVAAFETQLLDLHTRTRRSEKLAPRFAVAAHSLGCHLFAAWLAHSAHADWINAALLVAPPDLNRDDLPPAVARWAPAIETPFPRALQARSLLVGSDNDPFSSELATRALAMRWGVEATLKPNAGHLNADSGLGDWPEGWQQLQQLIDRERVKYGH